MNSVVLDGRKVGAIKRAIEYHINPKNGRSDFFLDYSNWYVGITNNTAKRRAQHEKQKCLTALHFQFWDAGSMSNAAAIERHFHEMGMLDKKGACGARQDSRFVYAFKRYSNLIDKIAHVFGVIG